MTHPASEALVRVALGEDDAVTAAHVAACAPCRTQVEQLRESAGLMRSGALLDRRIESPDCLDELVIAEFVEGRLGAEARGPVVTHLLTCARCRGAVKTTADLAARVEAPVDLRQRAGRWALPLGIVAAAVVLVLILPRIRDDGLSPTREPPLTSTIAPRPILPRGSVPHLDRLIWSSVPHAQRYRLRLYDAQGSVVWQADIKDTVATPSPALAVSPGVYFWRVEAETEWRRWAASDLISFRITEPAR